MNATDYWNFFVETGVPEYYLLYQKALKMEAKHVPVSYTHLTLPTMAVV